MLVNTYQPVENMFSASGKSLLSDGTYLDESPEELMALLQPALEDAAMGRTLTTEQLQSHLRKRYQDAIQG